MFINLQNMFLYSQDIKFESNQIFKYFDTEHSSPDQTGIGDPMHEVCTKQVTTRIRTARMESRNFKKSKEKFACKKKSTRFGLGNPSGSPHPY